MNIEHQRRTMVISKTQMKNAQNNIANTVLFIFQAAFTQNKAKNATKRGINCVFICFFIQIGFRAFGFRALFTGVLFA